MGILTAALFILMGIGIQRLVLDPRGFLGDGALIICDNSDRIFLISGGLKHVLPADLAFAQELGFKLDNIVQVSCDFLDGLEEGEPIESLITTEFGLDILSKVI